MSLNSESFKSRFEIKETFIGGHSLVYKAFDLKLKRTVAIKTPNEAVSLDPNSLEKFLEEGRKLARIRNKYVLMVHHFYEPGEIDEKCLLVTEWMDQTLEDVIKK